MDIHNIDVRATALRWPALMRKVRARAVTKVYVVDPDDGIREGLTAFLESFDIPLETYLGAVAFLSEADLSRGGCVLLDAESSDANGLALLTQLRNQGNAIPVILMASNPSTEFKQRARAAGARGVLEKPLVNDDLVMQLQLLRIPSWSGITIAGTRRVTLACGDDIAIRPISPSDRQMEQAFVQGLSIQSRHRRFFSVLNELPEQMLVRFTHNHYPTDVAFIATIARAGVQEQIGVARYATGDQHRTEFAIAVADAWQGRGVGTLLLRHLLHCASVAGIQCMAGTVLRENRGMLNLARCFGFRVQVDASDASLANLSLVLPAPGVHPLPAPPNLS